MKIIKNNPDLLDFLDVLQSRAADAGSAVDRDVRAILDDVKENGDSSVLKYTKKFDDKNPLQAKKRPEVQ